MKIISFQLTMPNIGSWNGKWTGADKKYYVIKRVADKTANKILEGDTSNNFHYSFGDGWSANVRVELIDSIEAKQRRKNSAGFYGYEWMVNSILIYQDIQYRKALS